MCCGMSEREQYAPCHTAGVSPGVCHRVLRWLDVSCNDIKDFSGMGTMKSLEWLNIQNNDVSSLSGTAVNVGVAPQVCARTSLTRLGVLLALNRAGVVPGTHVRKLAPQRPAKLGRGGRVPRVDEARRFIQ